jgi:hypothetical protein
MAAPALRSTHAGVELATLLDGTTYLPRRNARLTPLHVGAALTREVDVEAIFRWARSLLATRPIVHKCDDTIRPNQIGTRVRIGG